MSEKCLGTEVPVDYKSVRNRLMVSQVATKSIYLTRKDFGCIRCPSGRSIWKSRLPISIECRTRAVGESVQNFAEKSDHNCRLWGGCAAKFCVFKSDNL